jgi:hypothetical protein
MKYIWNVLRTENMLKLYEIPVHFSNFLNNILIPTISEKTSRDLGSVGYSGKMSYYKSNNLSLSIRAIFWNTLHKLIAGNANKVSLESHVYI